MRSTLAWILLGCAAMAQDPAPVVPRQDRVDLRLVNLTWGREVPAAGGRRFALRGHRTIYYLGPRRIRGHEALSKELGRLAGPRVPAAGGGRALRLLVLRTGPGVTCLDVAEVLALARRTGWAHIVLGPPEGTRAAPRAGRRQAAAALEIEVGLARFAAEPDAAILLPRAASATPPGKPRGRVRTGWTAPDGRPCPVIDLPQDGSVVFRGKVAAAAKRGSLAPRARLQDLLEHIAALEMHHRPDATGKTERPDGPLVLRADEWTEFFHVARIAEVCAGSQVRIQKIWLGVRAKPEK